MAAEPSTRVRTLRALVAFTPLLGTMLVPLVVPLTMKHIGIATGVGVALLVSTLWFAVMLRTSEMPEPEGESGH
ncbi:hypothetical protein [Synechococcus sp. RSCCF101]|uniref:hypothetical protein n=1 Tax=Synechococcus sp. RSCCF101 TaxID=2511069 RepID=UPI00351A1504